jgi:predicted ATP-binding protein involved in virulence
MRIDVLTIQNFNGFSKREFRFNPHFNLIIGDNGAGKSTVADALSVALGSWFLGIKGYARAVPIDQLEVRVEAHTFYDRFTFEKQFPARIEASGVAMGAEFTWARELGKERGHTTTVDTKEICAAAMEAERKVRANETVTLPLICAYETERCWFETPHRKRTKKHENSRQLPSRLDGYRDCVNFNIEESAVTDWIRSEVSAGEQRREETLAWKVVRCAIEGCVEGVSGLYYDERYRDLVADISPFGPQMLRNLSDGQRIMITFVADIARRAATLNPHLGEDVLMKTPGVVVVDELDLHLHPNWQRKIIHDLKRTFPAIQFIATTHSPQLVGETRPEEVFLLSTQGVNHPLRSYGIDSSRILTEIMRSRDRSLEIGELENLIATLIDEEKLDDAKSMVSKLESELGADDPEILRSRALIDVLESTR